MPDLNIDFGAGGDVPSWASKLAPDEYAMAMRGVFGVEAAAAYLGTSTRYVYKLVRQGKIPARKVGRYLRIQKAHLDEFLGIA